MSEHECVLDALRNHHQDEPELKADKGQFNGSCNRKACQAPGATWFNDSTYRYYCASCAHSINEANRDWARCGFHRQLCNPGIEGNGEPKEPRP